MNTIAKKIWNSTPSSWYKKLKHVLFDKILHRKDMWRVCTSTVGAHTLSLWMPRQMPETYKSMLDGSYESNVMVNLMTNKNNSALVIWDVGAHIGYQTLVFASLSDKKSRIYSFEPNPYNVKWLNANIKLNETCINRISVLKKALSDKSGKIEFNIGNSDDATSSGGYLEGTIPPLPEESYKNFHRISADMTTIDELISNENIPAPNLIKIDIEGAELKALQGGLKTLREYKPELIIEIHTIPMMFHVGNLLRELGYKIEIIDENNRIPTKIIHATHT